jgi:hypothetical protein
MIDLGPKVDGRVGKVEERKGFEPTKILYAH